ncbi:MAG: Lacal_2735 family protein [Xanthomarina sp.]
MENSVKIKENQIKLLKKYKKLIEQAYNLRQTDCAMSDISEFKAIKLLNKLNRLKYLSREPVKHRLT